MADLTARQVETLRRVAFHIAEYGRPPTVRELSVAMGIPSKSAALCHLNAIERKGVIARSSHRSRAITLLEAARPYLEGFNVRTLSEREFIGPTQCGKCGTQTFDADAPCTECRRVRLGLERKETADGLG